MQPIDRTGRHSLRRQVEVASWAGLITTAALAGLLLFIAMTTREALNAAHRTHERVQVYTELDRAMFDLQVAKFQQMRRTDNASDQAVAAGWAKLNGLFRAADRLPTVTARERSVAREISRQETAVRRYIANVPRLLRGVDARVQTGGSTAMMRELRRISLPVSALSATLQREIRAGGAQVVRRTDQAHWLIRLAVGASLLGLALAIGFSLTVYVLLRKRLQPGLVGLERGAQEFAAGNLGYRIGLSGSDELTRLATAFNGMAQTVFDKQQTLREAQVGLEQKVALRTQQLQSANAELSAADERRRAFLADVSHELRTPLTIIRGETQVALRTADDPQFDANDVFERILKLTLDMSRMVDDLFIIALAEAGALPLERETLDLHDVASRVAADFGILASEAGGSVSVQGSHGCFASIDPERVRRAIAALVENALRHCHSTVKVEIEIYRANGCPVVAVSDDGPGIDPSLASEVFARFRRGDTRGEGSGLGLSLVGALMEAHGGRAYLAAGDRGGTRAVLEFPAPARVRLAS